MGSHFTKSIQVFNMSFAKDHICRDEEIAEDQERIEEILSENESDEDLERMEELCRKREILQIEKAEIDRQLEAAQAEHCRLKNILQQGEEKTEKDKQKIRTEIAEMISKRDDPALSEEDKAEISMKIKSAEQMLAFISQHCGNHESADTDEDRLRKEELRRGNEAYVILRF